MARDRAASAGRRRVPQANHEVEKGTVRRPASSGVVKEALIFFATTYEQHRMILKRHATNDNFVSVCTKLKNDLNLYLELMGLRY